MTGSFGVVSILEVATQMQEAYVSSLSSPIPEYCERLLLMMFRRSERYVLRSKCRGLSHVEFFHLQSIVTNTHNFCYHLTKAFPSRWQKKPDAALKFGHGLHAEEPAGVIFFDDSLSTYTQCNGTLLSALKHHSRGMCYIQREMHLLAWKRG